MVKRIRLSPETTASNPSPVLITESAEEFERFNEDFDDELKPRGALERYLVGDMAGNAWEIHRLRRVKTSLINSSLRPGLQKLLEWLLPYSGRMDHTQWHSGLSRLADQWFGDEHDKKKVLQILEKFKLDEPAIEAAAVRFVAQDLEKIDQLIGALEWRLNKALRMLAELRTAGLAGNFTPRSSESSMVRFLRSTMPQRNRPRRQPDHGHRPTNCRQSSKRETQHRPALARW